METRNDRGKRMEKGKEGKINEDRNNK